MSAAGESIVLDPSVQGTHLKRWTVWGMLRTDVVARGVPWIRILLRHRNATTSLNLGWRHRLTALMVFLTIAAVALRNPLAVVLAVVGIVFLNRAFYALLLRRRGPLETAAGIVLHALHHLACAVSIPIGVFLHLRDRHRSSHA